MPLTKLSNALAEADWYSHSTSRENLEKMLQDGARIKTLRHLAKNDPNLRVSVEPYRWLRTREEMPVSEAVTRLKNESKHPDKVFLVRGGVEPSYGQYSILKKLKGPKPHDDVNLIPNEYVTPRALSLRSNARVYAPDDELDALKSQYPGIRFVGRSELPVPELGRVQGAVTLAEKLKRRFMSKFAGEAPPLSVAQLRRSVGRNAIQVGSEALGTNVGQGSDIDIFAPYKRRDAYEKAMSRLRERYPEFQESKANAARQDKYTLSGKINGKDVDLVLGYGDKAQNFLGAFENAKQRLTPDKADEIRQNKEQLQKAWLLREWRYKRYKNQVADELGLKEHYF